MVRRRRRRRRITTSRRRFIVPYRFEVLMDSIQSELGKHGDKSLKAVFPILEALAGIVGRKAMLEAVRWQQAGLVRLIEAEVHHVPKRSVAWQQFQSKERFATEESRRPHSADQSSSESTGESSSTHSLPSCASSFYEVTPIRASHNAHQLLPNVNFCTCKEFQNRVVKRKKRITCSHVLAVWLSKYLQSYNHVIVRKKIIDLVSQHMVSRSKEFF